MVWDRGVGLERRGEVGGGGKVSSCGILGPLARRGVAKPPAGTLPCPWYQWCVIVMCDSDRLELGTVHYIIIKLTVHKLSPLNQVTKKNIICQIRSGVFTVCCSLS